MIPEEVFKRRRRHNNTPESILLIIANFIVISITGPLFKTGANSNWFFWTVIGLLAIYNFFTIRRNREEYNTITTTVYVISNIILIILFFILKGKA